MKHTSFLPSRALALMPLLASISRELQERSAELEALEARLEELPSGDPHVDAERRDLVARIANHRREVRAARHELDQLGCSVVGTTPLTLRIPTREGSRRTSLVWQPDLAVRD